MLVAVHSFVIIALATLEKCVCECVGEGVGCCFVDCRKEVPAKRIRKTTQQVVISSPMLFIFLQLGISFDDDKIWWAHLNACDPDCVNWMPFFHLSTLLLSFSLLHSAFCAYWCNIIIVDEFRNGNKFVYYTHTKYIHTESENIIVGIQGSDNRHMHTIYVRDINTQLYLMYQCRFMNHDTETYSLEYAIVKSVKKCLHIFSSSCRLFSYCCCSSCCNFCTLRVFVSCLSPSFFLMLSRFVQNMWYYVDCVQQYEIRMNPICRRYMWQCVCWRDMHFSIISIRIVISSLYATHISHSA